MPTFPMASKWVFLHSCEYRGFSMNFCIAHKGNLSDVVDDSVKGRRVEGFLFCCLADVTPCFLIFYVLQIDVAFVFFSNNL